MREENWTYSIFLTSDTSIVTAVIAMINGYEALFARQVQPLGVQSECISRHSQPSGNFLMLCDAYPCCIMKKQMPVMLLTGRDGWGKS